MAARARAMRDEIQRLLRERADPTRKAGMDRYFKGAIPWLGLYAAEVRRVVQEAGRTEMKGAAKSEWRDVGMLLLREGMGEEKSAGVLCLAKTAKIFTDRYVDELAPVVDAHVYDWSTADGVASKVLADAIRANGALAPRIAAWRSAACPWRKRISCVAFCKLAKDGTHHDLIFETCGVCVQTQERFVQLGVGWVLREVSKCGPDAEHRVVSFLYEHYHSFMREGLRYAIEKMQPATRREILQHGKASRKRARAPDVAPE